MLTYGYGSLTTVSPSSRTNHLILERSLTVAIYAKQIVVEKLIKHSSEKMINYKIL